MAGLSARLPSTGPYLLLSLKRSPRSLQWGSFSSPTMFLLSGFSSAYRARVTAPPALLAHLPSGGAGEPAHRDPRLSGLPLRSPLHFFLRHLSFLDIGYSPVTLPKALGGSFSPQKATTFVGCITQVYLFLCFGGSEGTLLAAVACDQYPAICHPLHYPALTSRKMCHCLAAVPWLSSSFPSLVQTSLAACLPFCRSSTIAHWFCEMPFTLQLNALLNEAASCALAGTIVMGSFLLTLVSYVHIPGASLQQGAGMQGAFATCTST